jgi:hypothetical protein
MSHQLSEQIFLKTDLICEKMVHLSQSSNSNKGNLFYNESGGNIDQNKKLTSDTHSQRDPTCPKIFSKMYFCRSENHTIQSEIKF